MSKMFKHIDLRIVTPSFDSHLTDLIIDLDHLRRKVLDGSTSPKIFFQVKTIFHMFESLGSARIEGNNTTVLEYIESKIDSKPSKKHQIIEIENIEEALAFIDANARDTDINRAFIAELHKLAVKDLPPPPDGEGDDTPGRYRTVEVKIAGSAHIPPQAVQVDEYMEELFGFLNRKVDKKYDLMKIAIAHHRFVWVHPFRNGNGRAVRLFTYALLLKNGFNVDEGRILNPTAVFCNNREEYYDKLALADTGSDTGNLEFCEYVLSGLKSEIEKIDKLLNYDYLKLNILFPAIQYSIDNKYISSREGKILRYVADKQFIRQKNIRDMIPSMSAMTISKWVRSLVAKKMLEEGKIKGKVYWLLFINNYLLRAIYHSMDSCNLLPVKDK